MTRSSAVYQLAVIAVVSAFFGIPLITNAATTDVLNSQKMSLAMGSNIGPGVLSGDVKSEALTSAVVISNDEALTPSMGPVGNANDVEEFPDVSGGITFYTVRAGDSVGSVATMFGLTKATVLSANPNIKGGKLQLGDTLVILPTSGVSHTIAKGDTVKSIAKAYKVDPQDVVFYNNLSSDTILNPGDVLMIPDGAHDNAPAATVPVKTTKPSVKPGIKNSGSTNVPMTKDGLYTTNKNGPSTMPITVHPLKLETKADLGTKLLRPIAVNVGRVSQGLHGKPRTAVDLAAPLGTPVRAVADGTVLLAITGGYNDGFGNYVILLSTVDGFKVQSIYAHLSKVSVVAGQQVSRGDVLGSVGRTGDATGYHLHVDIRGAKNPFADPSYTGE
jgi:murein DD-endopeptidase MepM/ murein hydrolase activator NlpD